MLKKNIILILLTGLILTSCEDDETTIPPPAFLLSSSTSSITVEGSTTLSVELANLETSVFGVSMQISYDASVVVVDTPSGFVQGPYFGTNAISLFETVDNTIHFSISAIQGDAMVNGTDKLCDFTVTGLSSGTTTYTIVPEEIHFIDDNGDAVIITDL
ncbi:uncharacterized protein METZ01_LOCUS460879, partial [marine metagenome]